MCLCVFVGQCVTKRSPNQKVKWTNYLRWADHHIWQLKHGPWFITDDYVTLVKDDRDWPWCRCFPGAPTLCWEKSKSKQESIGLVSSAVNSLSWVPLFSWTYRRFIYLCVTFISQLFFIAICYMQISRHGILTVSDQGQSSSSRNKATNSY